MPRLIIGMIAAVLAFGLVPGLSGSRAQIGPEPLFPFPGLWEGGPLNAPSGGDNQPGWSSIEDGGLIFRAEENTGRPVQPSDDPFPRIDPTLIVGTSDPTPEERADEQTEAETPSETAAISRFVIPARDLNLTGEIDSRQWTVFLTEAQANSQADFELQFINSVVVTPEYSELGISMNGVSVYRTPIDASDAPRTDTFIIPDGVLRPGTNTIRMEARQAHRVDCSVEATYELWTSILPFGTGFRFADPDAGAITSIADLPAIGAGPDGKTLIHVIDLFDSSPETLQNYIDAVQTVSLLGRFPHPVVDLTDQPLTLTDPSGHLVLIVGTADRIEETLGFKPERASDGPVFDVISSNGTLVPIVVASGPDTAAVKAALASAAERASMDFEAISVVPTSPWSSPNAPLLEHGRSVTFADLGVATQEFSGRRYKTEFLFGLAPDFYAEAYGEAILYLDAGFSPDVEPQSRIDIYVNDKTASTMRLRTTEGVLMSQQPIRIPMRNFRPGLNVLRLEAVLESETDWACAPGTTRAREARFAIFDSTRFRMPPYARITRRPDLAPFAAGALPYGLGDAPTYMSIDAGDHLSLSAGGTLAARLAGLRGKSLPIEVTNSLAAIEGRPAILVQPMHTLPTGLLDRFGIEQTAETERPRSIDRRNGSAPDNGGTRTLPARTLPDDLSASAIASFNGDNEDLRSQWRDQVSGNLVARVVRGFRDWFLVNSGITGEELGIDIDQSKLRFSSEKTELIIAQASNFRGNAAWTLVTGRSSEDIDAGLRDISSPFVWNSIGGRATELARETHQISTEPVETFVFVATSPLGILNLRRIAANWFSTNIVAFAILMVALCVLLGLATTLMVRMGRRNL